MDRETAFRTAFAGCVLSETLQQYAHRHKVMDLATAWRHQWEHEATDRVLSVIAGY